MRRLITSLFLLQALAGRVALAQRPVAPATGVELLQTMRDAYANKWFTSLTFLQRTTIRTAAGKDTSATWYESLRYTDAKGAELRIDVGEPSAGNGVLYTADSIWRFRGGTLVSAGPGGNALIPLIAGVYLQPVARTIAELKPTGVDLARSVVSGKWHDRPVWIAGALSAADSTSPQFWVDAESKVVVRAIFKPVPAAPVMDMRFEKIVPVAGGWLGTRCEFYVDGAFKQLEVYEDWKGNVALAPGLFDPATFSTAPHWAGTPSAALPK